MRTRTGCQPCRERHIKCVKQPGADECEKCIENRRECVQKNALHRFRPVKSVISNRPHNGQSARQTLTHDPAQVWVDVPMINFAAESSESTTITNPLDLISNQPTKSAPERAKPISRNDQLSSQTHGADGQLHPDFEYAAVMTSQASTGRQHGVIQASLTSPASVHSYHSPVKRTSTYHSTTTLSPNAFDASPSQNNVQSQRDSAHSLQSPRSLLSALWPFRTPRESHLFYHYIKNIAPWLDVLDSRSWFGEDIPRHAAHQPVICNAIFAMASRHLSLISGSNDHESPPYVHECLNMVINILEDPMGHSDENLLAAVILLRSHEEMSDVDERCHYLGTARILNSIASYAADGGFKECASWFCLRQDIYVSLTSQQPLSLNLSNYRNSTVFSDQSDTSWANRIVFTFASILNYVFGAADTHNGPNRWSDLEAEVEAWNLTKPWYFSALWTQYAADESRPWPELHTSHPAHVVGL